MKQKNGHKYQWIGLPLILMTFLSLNLIYQSNGTYRDVIFDQKSYYRLSIALVERLPLEFHIELPSIDKLNIDVFENDALFMKRLSLQGPTYPVFLAGAQILTQSAEINALRTSQIFLLLLTLVMLYKIAKNLQGKNYALLTATLFTIYLPFTYMTPQLLTENLAVFLVVLIAFLSFQLIRVSGSFRNCCITLLCLAISLTLLYLTRPVYIYFV
jgi:hypothetical protein